MVKNSPYKIKMDHLLFLNIGSKELVLIAFFGLIPMLLTLISLIDLTRSNFSAKNTKSIWILIVLFAPVLGALLYLAIGRSKKTSK